MQGEKTYVATVLQLEGAAVMLMAVYAYHAIGGPWLWFGAFFLVPDLSMLGYLGGVRAGAVVYNVVHTYVLPFVLLLLWLIVREIDVLQVVAIWVAHIGTDRMLGFGLKDLTGFKHTHLQRV
jgi:hypothetical protein